MTSYNPFTMFMEKTERGDVLWSMTRVVAFLGALSFNFALVHYAKSGKDIGWPFCALGVITLLAVPLQALFKYVQLWFSSSPGQKVLRELMTRLGTAATSKVTTSTEVETGTG